MNETQEHGSWRESVAALQAAAQSLAARDSDRARYENGVGFSKPDGAFGHAIAGLPLDEWNAAITWAAWDCLRHYKKTQLTDFDSIPVPPRVEQYIEKDSAWGVSRVLAGREEARQIAWRKKRDAERVASNRIDFADGKFKITFKYDERLVEEVRKIPGRAFKNPPPVWEVPGTQAILVRKFAERWNFTLTDAALAVPMLEVVKPSNLSEVKVVGGRFHVTFATFIDEYKMTLLKRQTGAKWSKANRYWWFKADVHEARRFLQWREKCGVPFTPESVAAVQAIIDAAMHWVELSKALDADIDVPGIAAGYPLHPYQRAGVHYAIEKWNHDGKGVLIGDVMGLGKTPQGMAAVIKADALPAILVVPNIVLLNWPKEIKRFFPGKTVQVITGTSRAPIPTGYDFTVLAYSIVGDRYLDLIEYAEKVGVKGLIVDESHKVKNGSHTWLCPECEKKVKYNSDACSNKECPTFGKSKIEPVEHWTVKRTLGLIKLSRALPEARKVALTGTAVVNRPKELINQLDFLDRLDDFGGRSKFVTRYCEGHQTKNGYDTSGASNGAELNERLRMTCMVRREKQWVIKDLPPRQHSTVELDIAKAKRAEYDKAEANVIEFVANRARELMLESGATEIEAQREYMVKKMKAEAAEHLVRIGALKRASTEAKLDAVIEWIDDFLDGSDEKLVIFGENIEVVEGIWNRYKDKYGAVKIRGGVKDADREVAKETFQNDPKCRVFVGNIAAASEGITLTAASNVVFVQLAWTPGAHDQAIDRCYGRINDAHGAVGHYLLMNNSIEDDIMDLLAEKRGVVDAVLDGKVADKGQESGSIAGDLLVRLADKGLAAVH